jgi:hypothetical protein
MIRQPRNNNTLRWSVDFSTRRNRQFDRAQEFVDSEVLRLTTPYVPRDEGDLIRSGIRNTVIGSGKVSYRTPYARRLYYSRGFSFRGAPQRGERWFERMKRQHKKYILVRAREVFERG